jgi:hypothetical protein
MKTSVVSMAGRPTPPRPPFKSAMEPCGNRTDVPISACGAAAGDCAALAHGVKSYRIGQEPIPIQQLNGKTSTCGVLEPLPALATNIRRNGSIGMVGVTSNAFLVCFLAKQGL